MDANSSHDAALDSAKTNFFEFLDQYVLPESDQVESSKLTAASTESSQAIPYYVQQLHQMRDSEKTTLYVQRVHLADYDYDLSQFIEEHHHRVEPYLRKAVQDLVRKHIAAYAQNEGAEQSIKEFWVAFWGLSNTDKLRGLRTEHIGKLRAFSGTITRTSEVRPELFLASFKCVECNHVVHDVEQHFKWTTPVICTNETCGNRRNWLLVREQSKFIDWQKVKVQEVSDEVPAGSLPRTMEVILRNDIVESARAGDKMVFTGNLLVVPDVAAITAPGERVQTKPGQGGFSGQGISGLKMLGCRDLTYRLAFLACATQATEQSTGGANIRAHEDATQQEVYDSYQESQQTEVDQMRANAQIYRDLTKSIAPQVYGHDDIKRAVLLMLFGGVHKQTREGINLRGDINVAIVGDPSCGKSQILKYVASFLPRAVYTSGKSSSAAGLTASVVKEADSNEFCIEAGALMLADNGICCIDEFDKMDVKDQVAIHEAMEQQTISIAKAGIQASLNARTSILAAANPLGGRYDNSKALKYNVALPPAILSRFDMLHIMVDEPNDDADNQIATHIVKVHQRRERAFNVPYTMSQVQRYIKYARSIKPQVSAQAKEALVASYRSLRAGDATGGSVYRITVRQLEALVRLSEAHARVRCSPVIELRDVREAKRLVKSSILSVESTEQDVDDEDFVQDNAEVTDFVNAHRGSDMPPAANDRQEGEDMDTDEPAAAEPPASRQGARAQSTGAQQPAAPDAAGEAQAEAAANAQPPPRQGTKVSQKKVDQVKTLLVQRLREEESAEAASSSDELAQIGMVQKQLLSWYFDKMVESQQYQSTEELTKDYVLVCKIVHHLIKRDNVLIVLSTPSRQEEETNEEFAKRQQQERVLAVNPNYSID